MRRPSKRAWWTTRWVGVMRGGDTDTNAAICGALLGSVWGLDAIPAQWADCVLACRPSADNPAVQRPRPACYWPIEALELAGWLLDHDSRYL